MVWDDTILNFVQKNLKDQKKWEGGLVKEDSAISPGETWGDPAADVPEERDKNGDNISSGSKKLKLAQIAIFAVNIIMYYIF